MLALFPPDYKIRFAALLAGVVLIVGNGSLDAAIYVKIPNVPGDVTTAGFDDGKWFEADSGSYGTERDLTEAGGKGGTQDINIGIGELLPIGLSFYLNRATAPLLQASIQGNLLGDVEIHLVEPNANSPDPDDTFTFSIIKLTRAFVKSWLTSGDADDRPFFEITLLYNEIEVTNRIFNPADPRRPAEFTTYWDLVKNTGTYNEGGTAPNQKPTISRFNAISMTEDGSTTIPFTVQDPDGAAANLTVATTSSNRSLLPNSRIATSGPGSSRLLKLTPAPNRHGTATVTVSVSDQSSSVSTSFLVTVIPSPDPPAIASIDPQITDSDTPLTLPVTPSDPDEAAENLLLAATSSNPALLPDSNITFEHDATGWQMTLTPAAGQSGSADVTVTVTDTTGRSTSTSFLFTVNSAGNSAPTDILLTPNTLPENSPEGTVVGDLSAVDPESDPSVTFALLRDAGDRFRLINGGQIATTETAAFDYETRSSHTIRVRATDSQGAAFAKSLTILVTNFNEPPEVSLDLPPSIPPAAPPGIPIPYPNIAFSDPDSGTEPVTLTLDVIHGTLRIDDSGVLSGQVTGNGTRILTVNSPVADIIQVLSARGLTYTSNPGYEGADSLSATINDNGHSGDGDPLSASTSEPFFVKPEPVLGWRESSFTPAELEDPTISGLLVDSDGDELSTLAEYKLAKNPRDPSDTWDNIEITEIEDPESAAIFLQLSFIQRTDESDPNTVLTVEIADNLSGWASGPAVLQIVQRVPLGDGLERLVVRPTFPTSTVPTQFFRFKVEYLGLSPTP